MSPEQEQEVNGDEYRGQILKSWELARSAMSRDDPNWGAADHHIRDSIRLARELGDDAELAKCHFHYAELLRDQGYTEHAIQQLDKATALFHEMGLDEWLDKSQVLADQLKAE